jgi:transmembrane sensor
LEQDLYLLIIRYLNKQTTAEESAFITTWVNRSEENRQAFVQLEEIWSATARKATAGETSAEDEATAKALSVVQQRIRNRRTIAIRRIAAAAALLILVMACGFLFTRHQTNYMAWQSAPGQILQFTLPDGSHVHLAPQSRLRYNNREIILDGEAFFDVTKNAHQPFTVHAGKLDVQVLGTRFNVTHQRVSLVDGKVKVSVGDHAYALQPGQELSYDSATGLCDQHTYDLETVTGWTNRLLVFRNETLADAAHKIEQLYGVQIVFADTTIASYRLFARFDNKSLDYILNVIKATDNLNYTIKDKTIYITR